MKSNCEATAGVTCAHVEATVRLCRGLRKAAKQRTWLVGTVFLSPAACTGCARGNRRPDYACNSNSNYCGKKIPPLRERSSHSDPRRLPRYLLFCKSAR